MLHACPLLRASGRSKLRHYKDLVFGVAGQDKVKKNPEQYHS